MHDDLEHSNLSLHWPYTGESDFLETRHKTTKENHELDEKKRYVKNELDEKTN